MIILNRFQRGGIIVSNVDGSCGTWNELERLVHVLRLDKDDNVNDGKTGAKDGPKDTN